MKSDSEIKSDNNDLGMVARKMFVSHLCVLHGAELRYPAAWLH